jgi:hypothetical protein
LMGCNKFIVNVAGFDNLIEPLIIFDLPNNMKITKITRLLRG